MKAIIGDIVTQRYLDLYYVYDFMILSNYSKRIGLWLSITSRSSYKQCQVTYVCVSSESNARHFLTGSRFSSPRVMAPNKSRRRCSFHACALIDWRRRETKRQERQTDRHRLRFPSVDDTNKNKYGGRSFGALYSTDHTCWSMLMLWGAYSNRFIRHNSLVPCFLWYNSRNNSLDLACLGPVSQNPKSK